LLVSSVFVACCGAAAVCAAKSPSEEFEEKMGPHKPREFVLPAAAESQQPETQGAKEPAPNVRIMELGRRNTPRIQGDNEHLNDAIRREREDAYRARSSEMPKPKQIYCEGSPPVCSMR
jgi:hypothetical protein